MRQIIHTEISIGGRQGLSLQQLITKLIGQAMPSALRARTILLNHISDDFFIGADPDVISPVVSELIELMVSNSRAGLITVSADKFRDIIILELCDSNSYNGYAVTAGLSRLEPLARAVGGYLSLNGANKLQTSISFSFPEKSPELGTC